MKGSKLWYRYVDDTFNVLNIYDNEPFSQHLTNIKPNITFTREDADGMILFLDVMIHVNDDDGTHTDQFNFSTTYNTRDQW